MTNESFIKVNNKLVLVNGHPITINDIDDGSSGAAKETWVLNETINRGAAVSFSANFTSNGFSYIGLELRRGAPTPGGISCDLCYKKDSGGITVVLGGDMISWESPAYRKLTFDTPPTGDLLTWLQANAVKQPDDTAVQDTKALTITSNGTVSVTPDAPYDALKKVDVTVNVASGGGGGAPSLQSKSVTYTSNGTSTITPDEGYDGLSSVDVTVNVSGGGSSGGGYFGDMKIKNIKTDLTIKDMSVVSCTFSDGDYSFSNLCSNVTFSNCIFGSCMVNCTQEIHDAIVNGENNEYSSAYFNIIS